MQRRSTRLMKTPLKELESSRKYNSDSESSGSEQDFTQKNTRRTPRKRKTNQSDSKNSGSDENFPATPNKNPKKQRRKITSSSSESDIETYLKPASEIDLNSSFFKSNKDEIPSFDQIEKEMFSGITVTRLSDSDSSDDEEEESKNVEENITVPQISISESAEKDTEYLQSVKEGEEIARLNFQRLQDYTKKMEEAKKSVELYQAKELQRNVQQEQVCEEKINIRELLAMGEDQNDKDASYSKSLASKPVVDAEKDPYYDSEQEDWEEINASGNEEESLVPKKEIEITVEMPSNMKKKKGVDLLTSVKRRLNRIKKENQLLIHKVHLLCWIAHGNYVNNILNDENTLALGLSLIPSGKDFPSKRIDLNYLEKILKWYRKTIPLSERSLPSNKSLEDMLTEQIDKKEAYNKGMLAMIFIVILRSLGIQCRLVLSLQVEPLRPPNSDLHFLGNASSSKVKEEKTEKNTSKISDKKTNSEKVEIAAPNSKKDEMKTDKSRKSENFSKQDNTESSKNIKKDKSKYFKKNESKSSANKQNDEKLRKEKSEQKETKNKSTRHSKTVESRENKDKNTIREEDSEPKNTSNRHSKTDENREKKDKNKIEEDDSETKNKSTRRSKTVENKEKKDKNKIKETDSDSKMKDEAIISSNTKRTSRSRESLKKEESNKSEKESKEKRKQKETKSEKEITKNNEKKPSRVTRSNTRSPIENHTNRSKSTSTLKVNLERIDEENTKHRSKSSSTTTKKNIPQLDGMDDSAEFKGFEEKKSVNGSKFEQFYSKIYNEVTNKATTSKVNLKKLKSSSSNDDEDCKSRKHRRSVKKPSYVEKHTSGSENDFEDSFEKKKIRLEKEKKGENPVKKRGKVNLDKLRRSTLSKNEKSEQKSTSKELDVRQDIMNLIKGRIQEQKHIDRSKLVKTKRKISHETDSEDSDYVPEPIKKKYQDSDDEFYPKLKIKKRTQVREMVKKIRMKKDKPKDSNSRKVISSDSEYTEEEVVVKKEEPVKEKKKKGNDIWLEVFLDMEEKWMSVDVVSGQAHCVNELFSRASHPVSYVLAWNNLNHIKDITRRYCQNFNTVTRKLRIDAKWWESSLKPFMGPKNARDREEDDELDRQQQDKPLPTTISEYKNHPLYALERHLLKFEALYPPNAVPLGYVRNEPVYSRDCVFICHSRDIWLKQAKVVKRKEQPYKIVKARPKYDKLSNTMITGQNLEIFGPWQVEDYDPPAAENGIVPRNAFGNVDLFKPCMLPKKCVHLQLPGLNKTARKLNIDCASAIVGFDFHGGWSHPVYDGFVVCEEFEDELVAAWNIEQEEQEKKDQEKYEKRVYGNWKKLIRGLLIRERLKAKYGFGQTAKEDADDADDSTEKKTVVDSKNKKKNRRIMSDSEDD